MGGGGEGGMGGGEEGGGGGGGGGGGSRAMEGGMCASPGIGCAKDPNGTELKKLEFGGGPGGMIC